MTDRPLTIPNQKSLKELAVAIEASGGQFFAKKFP